VSDGQTVTVVKDMGLVTQVFDERHLAPLEGHLAIGHNRYSTTGSSTWRNAQPVYRSVGDAGRARPQRQPHQHRRLAPLGMLPGMIQIRGSLDSTTDLRYREVDHAEYGTERSDGRDQTAPGASCRLKGGFSFVLMDGAHLIGLKPPVSGRLCWSGRRQLGARERNRGLDIVSARDAQIEPGERS
jgi:amidophosphoribosyltransferase